MTTTEFNTYLESLREEYGRRCSECNNLIKKCNELQKNHAEEVCDLTNLLEKVQNDYCDLRQAYVATQRELQTFKESTDEASAIDVLRKENEALTAALADAKAKNKQLYKVYCAYKSENETLHRRLNHMHYSIKLNDIIRVLM